MQVFGGNAEGTGEEYAVAEIGSTIVRLPLLDSAEGDAGEAGQLGLRPAQILTESFDASADGFNFGSSSGVFCHGAILPRK